MDFTFSDDQDALRESVRAFLAREAQSGYVREMADDQRGFTDAMWDKVAELGWPGLLVPESNGGIGLGLVLAGEHQLEGRFHVFHRLDCQGLTLGWVQAADVQKIIAAVAT